MPISATKNGITRNFSEIQWKNMPADKYGWVQISSVPNTTVPIPAELVQKKMVAGVTDVKPVEIVRQKPEVPEAVPEELIAKPKREPKKGTKK